jgi:hypothetical protein
MRIAKLLLLAAAAVVLLSPLSASADNDLCKDVTFSFKNNYHLGTKIKVIKVQYRNVVNGTNPVVDVADVECTQGSTCRTAPVDLRDIEGDNVGSVRFILQYKELDKDWSDPTTTDSFEPNQKECRANRVYGVFPITK